MTDIKGEDSSLSRAKITNWAENVPLTNQFGMIIGSCRISDDGKLEAKITNSDTTAILYSSLSLKVSDGISIGPVEVAWERKKYSDEVRRRMEEQNPFKKEN